MASPQTDMGVLLVIGSIFFLIGLLGGGFEISALKVPSIGKSARAFAIGIGAMFMVIAIIKMVELPRVPSNLLSNTDPSTSETTSIAATLEPEDIPLVPTTLVEELMPHTVTLTSVENTMPSTASAVATQQAISSSLPISLPGMASSTPLRSPTKFGTLAVKTMPECNTRFILYSGDQQIAEGISNSETVIATGNYDIVLPGDLSGYRREHIVIRERETTIVDFSSEMGILQLGGYPNIDAPFSYNVFDKEGRFVTNSKIGANLCSWPGQYTVHLLVEPRNSTIDFDVEIKSKVKNIVNPEVWPNQSGYLSFSSIEQLYAEIVDSKGEQLISKNVQDGIWMLPGEYKVTIKEPYTDLIFEKVDIRGGEETVLELPDSLSTDTAITSTLPITPIASLTSVDSGPEPTVAQTDNGYTVVVTDTNGEGSTISDVQATTIPVYQWGGNLRIPLANINKIEGISEASFGFSLMRITMSDGQIIEGETNRGSINGNLAGVKYTINVPNIHSMAIVNKPASAQKTDVSSNLYDKITAIVLTQTGEELSLSEVEMIWLNNSSDLSDSDWFTLYKGGGELRLNLSEVKTIQIEQEGSKKSIAVETSAGSVLKGAPKYGWYIAGKIDGKENLGLFVIGLEDLSSANLGT